MGRPRSERPRRQLVRQLEAEGHLRDPAVRQAFLDVPRELFVPKFAKREGLGAVYRDEAIITRTDSRGAPTSSSSQPTIMAQMLERLRLREGMHVLEVGAGTGYNAALLSRIVGRSGRVVSVELDGDLARKARRALAAGGYRVRVVVGDGRLGWEEGAPYDRVIVTASVPDFPGPWVDQLADDGLVEVPLRLRRDGAQAIATLRKRGDRLRSVSVLCGGFIPLRSPGDDQRGDVPHLSVTEIVGGEPRPIVTLSGRALEALSATARRRLIALALSSGRVRRLRLPEHMRWSLWLYLSLELPARMVIAGWGAGSGGIGLIDRNGRSLALLGWARDAAPRISAYGEPEAERKLASLVEEWRRRGRPTEDNLEITVRLAGGHQRIRWRWT